jgi:hypothetical protein
MAGHLEWLASPHRQREQYLQCEKQRGRLCGAALGERSPERVNRRNGYRERRLDAQCRGRRDAQPRRPR